jgi:hypothetical protein
MNDSVLARLVVTIVVLIGFAVWLDAELTYKRSCEPNCSTDFSAIRR